MSEPDEASFGVRPRRISQAGTAEPVGLGGEAFSLDGMLAFARRFRWFLGIVIAPTLAAVLYYGLIASDIYMSEARFVVRGLNSARVSVLGNALQNVGLASSQDDTYSVRDFILSRDIVRKLEAAHGLSDDLSRPEGDFLTRFPPPFAGSSFEQLYKSYKRFVSVYVDDTSGITTLQVRAYRPDDSNALARAILEYSEDLVNKLNARARHDAVDIAEREVALYEKRVKDAQAAITAYRLRTKMLDPQNSSNSALQLIATLSAELASAQAQLFAIERSAPSSPQIAPLRDRISALETQIAAERTKVVGGNGSIALEISEYERLLLERELSDKDLVSAMTSLEEARLEAQRKQLYLERVVEPNMPDYPLYPERLISILEIFVSALLIYGIGWLVSASIREHVGR